MGVNNARKYQSLSALARATGLPSKWLALEADAGRLPCLRVGRRRLFDIELVQEMLRQRQEREVDGD